VTEHERIEAALRELGAQISVPEPPDTARLTASVRSRLAAPARRRWRGGSVLVRVAAVLVVAVVTLPVLMVVSPPVRAGVLDLLRHAGIEFSTNSESRPLPSPPSPLPNERVVDLPTAQRLSGFPIAVPAALGEPERVLLIGGQPPRVVSLLYRGGAIRLDQFDGSLDLALYKKLVGGGGIEWVPGFGAGPAIWVDRPHELVYVDRAGRYHKESARLSGKTLIWQAGDVTLRLEGDLTLDEAKAIAASVR
jgi:hypothetical protein